MEVDPVPDAGLLHKSIRLGANMVAVLWVGLGTIFFLIRFVTAFYGENAATIKELLAQMPWR